MSGYVVAVGASGLVDVRRSDGNAIRALVVDDEPMLAELVSMALRYEGWEVTSAGEGDAAVQAADRLEPDIAILDVMLPDVDGFELLRRLRSKHPLLPIVFLSARDSVEDRVEGLAAGGDDYVTKPFSLDELVARLKALLRRAAVTSPSEAPLSVGDLVMDEDAHEVRRGGDAIHLTSTEYDLLRYLMLNPKRVLSKQQILDHVWRYDFGGQANIVELYVSYLRKKIDAGRKPMLQTIRGVGYSLRPTR